jgi:hypothetical protein
LARLTIGVVFAALFAVPPVLAQPVTPEESLVLDRWEINIGAFATGINTQVRFDTPINKGTTINLEDDLGFDNNELVFSFTLAGMIGKRHQLELNYFEIDRSGLITTEFEIEWGDVVYPIQTDLITTYDSEFIGLNYTYWVRAREKSAWGATVGLVAFSTGTSAAIRATGSEGPGIGRDTEFAVDVPVLQVGLKWRQALSQKWVFIGDAAAIAFDDIDDFSGDVISGGVSFEYRAWQKFGFGGGYRLRDFDIDSGEKRNLGNYKFEIRGLYLYARVGW